LHRKCDCKIAKTAREAAAAQPPTFHDEDNNNACLHDSGQAYGNISHSEILFFSYFFAVLITLDLAYQAEQIICLSCSA
jgi:hypothetical protein